MNPQTVQLALEIAAIAARLLVEVRQQSGLSNEQLLALAEQKNAATRSAVEAFLSKLE